MPGTGDSISASDHAPRPFTLVLTDVVESTALAHHVGDARNAALWDEHDRLARSLLARWNGLEVQRTDGLLALFDNPESAFAFATAYRDALTTIQPPLETRIGIHQGDVVVRRNPQEFVARGAKPVEADGLALSLTARVAGMAGRAQILATRHALPDPPPPSESVGHWQLKGHPDPLEVCDVQPDGPSVMPPDGDKAYQVVRDGENWLPVREVPRALPAEWDRFVGRGEDLQALHDLVAGGARLVSVSGIGGTGKTRLVTHFAWRRLADYPGGVWFCDLTDARDRVDIAAVVSRTLGVVLGSDDPIATVGRAIAGRERCLVVLDNFEQVAREARNTLQLWLESAPEATFLVTTRVLLGLRGEVALSLPPLDELDAVSLFSVRAADAVPDLVLTDEERDDVRALVELLDYLPLAIELAAARVRTMRPPELYAQVRDRFHEMLAANTGREARQATLRRTLDWSWDLLEPDEKRALARFSVFEGGFTMAAAQALFADEPVWVPDLVQSLVDSSLVHKAEVHGERARFDLLVSVHTYAADQLDQSDDRIPSESRHGRYFADLGTPEAIGALRRSGGLARQRSLGVDIENVVAACRRAVKRGDVSVALPTLRAAWAVLDLTGPPALAATLAEEVGEVPGLPAGVRDRLVAEAHLARGSHVEGQQELRQSLQLLGRPEPRSFPLVVARVLIGAATQVARRQGWVRSGRRGDPETVLSATRAYQRLVETYWFACEPPRMLASALSALNLCEPLGATPELARAYATMALATSGLRFDTVADHYAGLAMRAAEESGSPLTEGYVRFLACVYRIGHARFAEVDRDLAHAIRLFTEHEDHRLLGDAVTVQGMAALYRGDVDLAGAHFGTVFVSGRRRSNVQHQVWGALGEAEVGLRQGELTRAVARMREARHVLETFASPMERARALGLDARITLETGDRDRARQLADEAVKALRGLGPPTSHYLLEGFAGACEVLIALGAPERGALRAMAAYAATFPIGEPRLAWLRAIRARRRGRDRAARRFVATGSGTAERLGMPEEAARLSDLAGSLAPPGIPAR